MTKTEFLPTTYTISTISSRKLIRIKKNISWLIQYQILQTNITGTVWQTVRRITNAIMGDKGLISFCGCLCVFQGWFHAVTCNESPEKRTISTLMESTRSTPQVPGLLWPTAIWHVTVEDGRYWLQATPTAGRHRMWNYETQTTQSWLMTSLFCNMRTELRITKKWLELRLNIA